MPFKSEAQRRFLWANRPDIAKRWANEPGTKNKGLPYHKKQASISKLAAFRDGFFSGLARLISGVK